ncbi:MAG: D-aminoacyl-tRNA deacylase [Pseudomonadota bacterium]
MRLVVQRVDKASVSVNNQVIASIGTGLLVFLGIERGDTAGDADLMLEKAINLRIFEDREGKMNLSLLDVAGGLLVVSQFTLLGDCWKGKRPSFIRAEDPEQAKGLYEYFIKRAVEKVARVAGGEFQAMMKVELVNDGPVTMLLDSRRRF